MVKEKELTRARDALAAQRRRMPWMEVVKDYRFEGPSDQHFRRPRLELTRERLHHVGDELPD